MRCVCLWLRSSCKLRAFIRTSTAGCGSALSDQTLDIHIGNANGDVLYWFSSFVFFFSLVALGCCRRLCIWSLSCSIGGAADIRRISFICLLTGGPRIHHFQKQARTRQPAGSRTGACLSCQDMMVRLNIFLGLAHNTTAVLLERVLVVSPLDLVIGARITIIRWMRFMEEIKNTKSAHVPLRQCWLASRRSGLRASR